MPKLDKKQEAFAQALALGTTLTEAARRSGYAHGDTNKAYLSRLSRKPQIASRIDEIKRDRMIALYESSAGQSFRAGATMAELGFTDGWITEQYLKVHAAALEAGSFPAANVALKNIETIIRKRDEALADGANDDALKGAEKISVKDTIAFLSDLRGLMTPSESAAPEPEAATGPSQTTVNNLRHRYDRD